MKKGLLLTLVLVLLCLAGIGLAEKLPSRLDEVGAPLPELPKAPAFDLEVTDTGVTVTITDGKKMNSMGYTIAGDGNYFYCVMQADATGTVFTYTFGEGEVPNTASDLLDFVVVDGDEETWHSFMVSAADKRVQAYGTLKNLGENKRLEVNWDEAGNLASVGYYVGDGGNEMSAVSFDENGDVVDYNIRNNDADLYWDAEGNLNNGIIYDENQMYEYYEGQWHLEGEVCEISGEAAEILAQMQAAFEARVSKGSKKLEEVKWYAKNSVCVAGLSLRDDLHMSDKWYNVAPIDLTQEGTQTLYLVAGNRHHIGKAYVTVADGSVTVDYKLHGGHGYIKGECVKWFTSLDEITDEFIENPASDLQFGEAVSIAEDLGGAKTGILFIRNVATYRQPYTNAGGELSRYWRNRDRWVESRQAMLDLLGIEAE